MNTKICTKCETEKPEEKFFFKNKEKNKRRAYCGDCEKESKREYYYKNSDKISKNVYKAKKERIKIAREYAIDYLKIHPCVDCNEKDILVLDFDHLGDKKHDVSYMIARGFSLEMIKAEIEKCEVRCSNCHRRKTAKQLGYYKLST